MLTKVYSAALHGAEALEVEIEVNEGSGDPKVVIVGLPDAAVKESKDRVTTAMANSGYRWPRGRMTINLAPADIKKEGPSFDLPIALGMLAVVRGADLGQPPAPFFALLTQAPAWLKIATLVLAVALVASSVDTLQSGLASLVVTETAGEASSSDQTAALTRARWITVALMVPVVLVALQGISVLRLFLIADLLCATAVVPVLMGVWRRMTAPAAMAGALAGVLGAVLPGWISGGSLAAGLLAASFPDSIPTLAPFAGALLASAVVSVLAAWARPGADEAATLRA